MQTLFPLAQADILIPMLDRLASDTQPRWGAMNAQQMIEHLDTILQYSISDQPIAILTPEAQLPHVVQWLRTDKPLPRGFNNPLIPVGPHRHPDLTAANQHLLVSLKRFFQHYTASPSHTSTHIVFGPLGYEDWQRFHQKHFQHHFTQFGLLDE
ncbi:DUF1569 domain-containing protein [Chitinophaga sp.]|uniref:DUF1569 domain-containing protein n=1 Tax=Chitinophaga sp. TaxID=1869181 RepID=UPI002632B733|nr:DUF1569 domain-containing protein [uncultured Chitinophaga sp.]